MQVIRAEHLGMCFGVRDAIDMAHRRAEAAPLTILGDLVHNAAVLAALRAKGIAIAQDPAHVKTQAVMVPAHGASERALSHTRSLGLLATGEVVKQVERLDFLRRARSRIRKNSG